MLRDLADVLLDLHEGMTAASQRWHTGVRLVDAQMALPMEVRAVFRDGGVVLQADVLRNLADAGWLAQPSRLTLTWSETPVETLP
ncbi:hypothetical protein N8I74_14420 [Chitiniphilus purpureus]|uniref:Uncharacterized protein n=1 Tax=Chitiniphilus purpureus TaxID=2981137 RepID=A0ABY6DRG5_9NEIS|nr:hypothetical protein [Chitiniphilus sp. CD1]UXY14503.1 hypothetical protein N8I74_14420 [Chitiniphilus sp. CD1]